MENFFILGIVLIYVNMVIIQMNMAIKYVNVLQMINARIVQRKAQN